MVPGTVALFGVECRVKYMGAAKTSANGSSIRNAIVYDENSEMFITFWDRGLFYLDENDVYH